MAPLTVTVDRAAALADARPGDPSPDRSAGPAAADRSGAGARADRTIRSWPLLVLAVPAGAEVRSGWVGIAQKTGFGLVRPLPGIWPSLHLDTAITFPIGVEAYAGLADPGRQRGRGVTGPGSREARPQVDQARVVARRLAAAGKPVSRRALRVGGVKGSNEALNALARMINNEIADAAPPGAPAS